MQNLTTNDKLSNFYSIYFIFWCKQNL